MPDRPAYFERVAGTFEGHYIDHQHKYDSTPRESDRILVAMVTEVTRQQGDATVLDIGCSTGNFLVHLRRAAPDLRLEGGDLASSALEVARANPELDGAHFEEMDILALPQRGYQVVVVNAVFYALDDDLFQRALSSIHDALAPGGHLVAFDFFHPFQQDLVIVERSRPQPEGAPLHFRPMGSTRERLGAAGYDDVHFHPFEIAIDLPQRMPPGSDDSGWADLETHTRMTTSGVRMLMRGPLSQPWCHLLARRAG